MSTEYPDNNPKTQFGVAKLPLEFIPPVGIGHVGLAFEHGAMKYGPFNWRQKKISSTVYYSAALRHLMAWYDGEDFDPDSGQHHLAHAAACCLMVLDVFETDKLNDNRPPPGTFSDLARKRGKSPPAPLESLICTVSP